LFVHEWQQIGRSKNYRGEQNIFPNRLRFSDHSETSYRTKYDPSLTSSSFYVTSFAFTVLHPIFRNTAMVSSTGITVVQVLQFWKNRVTMVQTLHLVWWKRHYCTPGIVYQFRSEVIGILYCQSWRTNTERPNTKPVTKPRQFRVWKSNRAISAVYNITVNIA
jgi:hypothetical protein